MLKYFNLNLMLFYNCRIIMPRLSHDQRVQIITLVDEGYTYAQLAQRFNCRKATVVDLVRKFRQTNSVEDLPKSGRRRASTERQDRYLVRLCTGNPLAPSRHLRHQWRDATDVAVSAVTVRRRLNEVGIHSYIAPRKPLLTARHRRTRLDWARQHVAWTAEDWSRVIFSDETPIHLVQTQQRHTVYRRKGARRQYGVYQPRLQAGGGSVMVWGAISINGVIPLHRLQGILTSVTYTNILEADLLTFLERQQQQFVFQQDNATAHSARRTMTWFQEHNIEVLKWPPCSPDLNIIENVWATVKRELDNRRDIRGKDELFQTASEIFNGLDAGYILNLFNSLPKRIAECIRNRGGHTHY